MQAFTVVEFTGSTMWPRGIRDIFREKLCLEGWRSHCRGEGAGWGGGGGSH